ncbi:MAG TPA: hypothetical protein VLH81_08600 [Desulfobacterales bacterium]|nr:hypothetical protein [Desulfobacterales bacterium]
MKYLIIRDQHGQEFPVFCLAPKTHEQMATAWLGARNSRGLPAEAPCEGRVIAAGFVEFLPAGVRVFGHSTSLNLYPRPQDAQLIAAVYRATLAMGETQQPSVISHAVDVALHRTS